MSSGVPDGFLGLDIGPKSIEMNDEAAGLSELPELEDLKGLCPTNSHGTHWFPSKRKWSSPKIRFLVRFHLKRKKVFSRHRDKCQDSM